MLVIPPDRQKIITFLLSIIDWYKDYFEVDFKLGTTAVNNTGITAETDNTNKFCTTTNGHTAIKEMQIECNGETVYNNTRANETSNLLQLLNYTKSYVDRVGKDQFFYLDTLLGHQNLVKRKHYTIKVLPNENINRCCKCK